MKVYAGLPQELVDGWKQSSPAWPPGTASAFHYHDVEEWLTVDEGEITFFTLADKPFHVEVGRALRIPRGEVHRTEVGPEGVVYRMFLPVAVTEFANDLSPSELDVLRRNLQFPDYEDGRVKRGREFFDEVLSDELMFCRADGTVVDKQQFIDGAFLDRGRSSSGSIRVLNKTANGMLVSTVVNQTAERTVRSFINLRFLAAEGGTLRCRLWATYLQLAADYDT